MCCYKHNNIPSHMKKSYGKSKRKLNRGVSTRVGKLGPAKGPIARKTTGLSFIDLIKSGKLK